MPKWEDEFLKSLYGSRALIVGPRSISSDALGELHRMYADMIEDIWHRFENQRLTPERARALIGSIRDRLERLQLDVNGELAKRIDRTIENTVAMHETGLERAAAATGQAAIVRTSFAAVPDMVLRVQAVRRGLGYSVNFKTLNQYHFAGTAQEVDRFIANAVGQGRSAQSAARDLAKMLARDDPYLMAALERRGRGGMQAAHGLKGMEIPPEKLKEARALLNSSRNIMVSEINSTHDEAHRIAADVSPVIDVIIWQVSGRHGGLPSSPDICDVLARANLYGLGPGAYRPANKPALPHPCCGCTQRFGLRSIEDWDSPKPDARPPKQASESEIRKLLKRGEGNRNVTEGLVRATAKNLNTHAQRAHDVYLQVRGIELRNRNAA